jgi:hypothetical protein
VPRSRTVSPNALAKPSHRAVGLPMTRCRATAGRPVQAVTRDLAERFAASLWLAEFAWPPRNRLALPRRFQPLLIFSLRGGQPAGAPGESTHWVCMSNCSNLRWRHSLCCEQRNHMLKHMRVTLAAVPGEIHFMKNILRYKHLIQVAMRDQTENKVGAGTRRRFPRCAQPRWPARSGTPPQARASREDRQTLAVPLVRDEEAAGLSRLYRFIRLIYSAIYRDRGHREPKQWVIFLPLRTRRTS